jgi:hypothetical protein
VLEGRGCYRMGWSYKNFENSFFEFVTRLGSDHLSERAESETIMKLLSQIQALSGPDVYDARLAIAITFKAAVLELKIASAGLNPIKGKPNGRIRRDGPGRYFEVRFRGGATHAGFPVGK